jgi:hypothetical protein
MSSNFNYFTYRIGGSLHIQLFGDFDGSSACELINALGEYGADFSQIFIDTNDLQTIHPFGGEVFQNRYSAISKQTGNIIFIGKHKYKIDPQKSELGFYS